VPLSHANLVASARSIVVALALLPHDRSLVVMPLFHIHGLMITLATLASGGTAACPGVFDPLRLAGWLAELAPTWYSAVPTIHHAVVAHAGLVSGAPELRSIRLVRSSSAPLPSRLGSELEALFGAPVIEAYGMTEAAHQITSNPLPPGERRPGSVGCPAGAEVMIVDEAGLPLPPGETGEVAIRGSGVTAGYESGADPRSRLSGGWLRTDDLGRLDRDGYLYLAGRLRELVNRGGQKIAPSEVEEVLGSHPAVAEAVVFSVPHPTLGEDVGAAVVLRPGAAAAPEALRAFARQRLADYKVPAQVRVVERVPLGPTGKLQRARMAELLGPAEGGSAAPPTTPMEAAVARVWRGLLGVEVGSGGNFFALGGDSLMAMRMLQALERACGVRLPVAAVFHAPTVEGLAAAVTLAAEGDWLVEELAALPETEALRLLAEIEGPPA
jgi:acyl-CoA synthetase (AMP-forming)/AMP-acid ligase II